MPSHYETLGVAKTASDADIKSAFRKLAMQCHPDKNPGDAAAEKKFKEINEAYEHLKDPAKRQAYDAAQANPFGQRGSHSADWEDIFAKRRQYGGSVHEDMFMEEILRRARQQQHAQQVKNKDTILKYTVTLEEVYAGKEVELRYSTSRNPSKTAKIVIPRSVRDGAKIRYAGMGDDLNPNAPAGDLYVVITIAQNDRFVRMDDNILTSVTIDFIDAILGVTRRVPCIDGSEINLRILAGMKPGDHIKVPEKGLWTDSGRRGHMLVEVVMQQPKLNNAQYELLAKIKDL